jgi:hypothetical protein
MVPTSYLRIHKPKSSRSHRFISRTAEASIVPTGQVIPQKQTLVNKKMPVLYLCYNMLCLSVVVPPFPIQSLYRPGRSVSSQKKLAQIQNKDSSCSASKTLTDPSSNRIIDGTSEENPS